MLLFEEIQQARGQLATLRPRSLRPYFRSEQSEGFCGGGPDDASGLRRPEAAPLAEESPESQGRSLGRGDSSGPGFSSRLQAWSRERGRRRIFESSVWSQVFRPKLAWWHRCSAYWILCNSLRPAVRVTPSGWRFGRGREIHRELRQRNRRVLDGSPTQRMSSTWDYAVVVSQEG